MDEKVCPCKSVREPWEFGERKEQESAREFSELLWVMHLDTFTCLRATWEERLNSILLSC